MCGIVGVFLKTDRYIDQLGHMTALMLEQMRERGPDSAGFAIYSDDSDERTKLTVLAEGRHIDWHKVTDELGTALGGEVNLRTTHDHAVLESELDGRAMRQWLINSVPDISVLSYGHAIELFKAVGDPGSEYRQQFTGIRERRFSAFAIELCAAQADVLCR